MEAILGTFLAVHSLELCASTTSRMGLISGQGIKILHATTSGQKKKREKKKLVFSNCCKIPGKSSYPTVPRESSPPCSGECRHRALEFISRPSYGQTLALLLHLLFHEGILVSPSVQRASWPFTEPILRGGCDLHLGSYLRPWSPF